MNSALFARHTIPSRPGRSRAEAAASSPDSAGHPARLRPWPALYTKSLCKCCFIITTPPLPPGPGRLQRLSKGHAGLLTRAGLHLRQLWTPAAFPLHRAEVSQRCGGMDARNLSALLAEQSGQGRQHPAGRSWANRTEPCWLLFLRGLHSQGCRCCCFELGSEKETDGEIGP